MELARQTSAFDLLRVDDATDSVPADTLGQVDRSCGARRERLGKPNVVVRKAQGRAQLVVRHNDPHRPPSHDERDIKSRPDAHTSCGLLVDLRIVEDGVDPLTSPALEYATRLRTAEFELHPHEAVCIGTFSIGCPDPKSLRHRLPGEL